MSLHALASHMATKGRGGDSMLVHMTPGEVQALQTLAERHGGTLTINPETGQPEANFLKKLLPAIAGFALAPLTAGTSLAFLGATPLASALTVGSITGLATGSLSRGLMAGLGAYGGASLGAGLASAGTNAMTTAGVGDYATTLTGKGLELGTPAFGEAASQMALESQKNALAAPLTDKLATGFTNPKALVTAMGGPAKTIGATYAAVSPMMAADTVQTTTPRADTGYIRQKKFNPYTQQYIDLEPVKASEWGSRSFSDFAEGGIVALAKGGVSDQDVQNWFATNTGATDAQIAAAMQQYNVAPEQVARVTGVGMPEVQQRFETAIAPQIVGQYTGGVEGPGGTTAVRGTGYLGIQDQLENAGVTAQELFNNPNYRGWSLPELEQAYNVANKIQQFDTGANSAALDDKAWAKFMDDNKFTVRNIAQATGLSEAEVQRRYDAAKFKPTVITTTTPGGGGSATDFLTATTPATYAPPGTTNPYGNGVTPGDLTFNRDGSVTVQPNIPGRPYGGFTGIRQLRDAYTAGGGSLGQSNLFVPKTPAELYERYGATGGSKQAYDYLTGKGAADIRRPVTSGQLMRPYAEAVLGQELAAATGKSTQRFIFDARTGRYIPNPAYVDPNLAKDKEKTTAPTVDESMGAAEGGVMRMALGGMAVAGGGTARDGLQQINSGTSTVSQAIDTATSALGGVGGGGSGGYRGLMDVLQPGLGQPFDGRNNAVDGFAMPHDLARPGGGSFGGFGGMPAGLDDSGMGAANATSQQKNAAIQTYLNPASASDLFRSLQSGAFANGGQVRRMALGGLGSLAGGGQAGYNLGGYSDGGRLLRGPGDGVSDSIPASIGRNRQPARLADGEFVVPARIVSELGNGSTEAGARKLYAMMDRVQKARGKTTGKNRVAANTRSDKYLPA